MTYQCLPVEAVLARGDQALHHRKWIAIKGDVTVYTQTRGVLQPKATVDNLAQIGIYAGGPVGVVLGKRQTKHVAGAYEMAAVALNEGM